MWVEVKWNDQIHFKKGYKFKELWRRWMSSEPKRDLRFVGNGGYGRLGLGSLESQWRPVPVFALPENQWLKPLLVVAPYPLLTDNGRVYAAGLNDFGQLGRSENISYSLEPIEVSGFGEGLCTSQLWMGSSTFGERNSNGQLGLGKVTHEPQLNVNVMSASYMKERFVGEEEGLEDLDGHESSILGFLRSSSVIQSSYRGQNAAAGLLHSACIDGISSTFLVPNLLHDVSYLTKVVGNYTLGAPMRMAALVSVLQMPFIHLKEFKVLFLDSCLQGLLWLEAYSSNSEGNVFTWGWGGSHGTFSEDGYSSGGQLGHGNDVDFIKPKMVNFGKNVKALQVSCGFNHSGAVLEYV
ncbi:uncharacterized protein LOC116135234 [Pistacia vera]|uniref:uncharacterized protein LOC116135234 n=1 Tax=Pistacia vera TaxID=55513 RepID=UPI001262F90D|nr:uncharacterized protein LOC116135234 [Pistacia vera]